jgi:multiple sugar transport system permease protein
MSLQASEVSQLGVLRERFRDVGDDYLPVWFMLPVVATLLTFTIFPFVYNVYLMFVEYDLSDPTSLGEFAGLSNLVSAFSNPTLWGAVGITLGFVVSALVLETVLGFLLAVLVQGTTRLRGLYRIVLLLPMAVAPISLATIGRVMLNSEIGVIPWLITNFTPFASPQFLSSDLALVTVISFNVWQWTPFMFIIFYAGLSSVPPDLVDAGRIDGAPLWRIYAHIIIPYIKPVLLVGILIRMIDLLRSFGLVYTLTSGGPGNATRLFSIHIYETAFTFLDLGAAGAMAIVYMFSIVAVSTLFIKVFDFEGVW